MRSLILLVLMSAPTLAQGYDWDKARDYQNACTDHYDECTRWLRDTYVPNYTELGIPGKAWYLSQVKIMSDYGTGSPEEVAAVNRLREWNKLQKLWQDFHDQVNRGRKFCIVEMIAAIKDKDVKRYMRAADGYAIYSQNAEDRWEGGFLAIPANGTGKQFHDLMGIGAAPPQYPDFTLKVPGLPDNPVPPPPPGE